MANKFKLLITPKAAEDFESIFVYINTALSNPTAARNLIDKFEKAIDRIRIMPECCPKVNNEYLKNKSLRKLIVENYIIFYKFNEENQNIELVRVLYGMMNFKDIL